MRESSEPMLERWRQHIEDLQVQTTTLLGWRYMWYKLGGIIDANPDIPSSSPFFDFISAAYATNQAVGIRRVAADARRDTLSLSRLLDEICRNPDVIKRDMFLLERNHAGRAVPPFDTGFHLFADESGDELDVRRIRQDAESLRSGIIQKVKHYVDEHVAHTSSNPRQGLPTFRDLNDALDLLEELVKRYYLLITQSSMPDMTPVFLDDWLAPFRVAWLRDQRALEDRP